jgi:hypothetical protein
MVGAMTGGPGHAPGVLRGVLRGRGDVRFTQMITPRLVGVVYVAAAGLVVFGSLVGVLMVWWLAAWAGGGWWWLAPLVLAAGFAGVLTVRIVCEWVLMAFTRGRPIDPTPRPAHPDKPVIRSAEPRREAQQERTPPPVSPPPVSRSRPPFPPAAARPMNPLPPQQRPPQRHGGSGDA